MHLHADLRVRQACCFILCRPAAASRGQHLASSSCCLGPGTISLQRIRRPMLGIVLTQQSRENCSASQRRSMLANSRSVCRLVRSEWLPVSLPRAAPQAPQAGCCSAGPAAGGAAHRAAATAQRHVPQQCTRPYKLTSRQCASRVPVCGSADHHIRRSQRACVADSLPPMLPSLDDNDTDTAVSLCGRVSSLTEGQVRTGDHGVPWTFPSPY